MMRVIFAMICFMIFQSVGIFGKELVDTDGNGFLNISTFEDLSAIQGDSKYLNSKLELDNDIDAGATVNMNSGDHDNYGETEDTPMGWEPVGSGAQTPFTGIFEGNGHTIRNLFINRPQAELVGFFGLAASGSAEIRNLNLQNCDYTAYDVSGGAVGAMAQGKMSNCRVSGRFVIISTHGQSGYAIGGLAGISGEEAVIEKCVVSDTRIYAYGYEYTPEIFSCGGLIGYNMGNVSQCFADAELEGRHKTAIGGLVGLNKGKISNARSESNIYTEEGKGVIAGFVALNYGEIKNSYSVGTVEGDDIKGGFTGSNIPESLNENEGRATACFWDYKTSGLSESAEGTSLSTSRMKEKETFTNVEWDFDNVWSISDDINEGYPYLIFNEPPDITVDIPVLVAPADDTERAKKLCVFEWEESEGGQLYRLYAENKITKEAVIDTVLDGILYTAGNDELKYNTEYIWKVMALRKSGKMSAWSETRVFITEKIPAPTNLTPNSEDFGIPLTACFLSWEHHPDCDTFNIVVSRDKTFEKTNLDAIAGDRNKIRLDSVTPGAVYYWKVASWSDGIAEKISGFSETAQFKVKDVLIDLREPETGSTITVDGTELLWSASIADYCLYELEMSDTEAFDNIVMKYSDISDNRLTISGDSLQTLQEYGTVYWRVRAVYLSYQGPYSQTFSFVISGSNVSDSDFCLVYPNPAEDIVKVDLSPGAVLILSDPSGKEVLRSKSSTVDVSDLPKGVYFVIIENGTSRISGKFVKK